MRKNKVIKIILTVIVIIVIALIGLMLYRKIQYENSKITGAEYMEKQEEYIQNLGLFYDTLDDVVLLGITNGIEDGQYRLAVEACTKNLLIMEEDYNLYNEEHPLRPETANEFQVDAFNAVYDMYSSTHYLMYSMYEGFSSEDELVYTYLMYKQSITNSLDTYLRAKEMDQRTIQ